MGKRLGVWGGVALLVVIVGLAAARALVNADAYRGRIEAALTQSLGRQVTLGHLDASVLSGSLVATTPSIADDPSFSSDPFLTAKQIKIGVDMLPLLLHHTLRVTGFTIEAPKISLVRADDGTWNYSSLGGKSTPASAPGALPDLTVAKIDIEDGTLTVGSRPAAGPARVYTGVNVSVEKFSFTGPFSFTLSAKLPGDGTLDLTGTAGPIAPGDASLTPVTADVELKHADLAAAGLVDPGAGVGGVADLSAKVVSSGQAAQLQGKLELTKLRLAKNGTPSEKPVDAQFSVSEDLKAMTGTVQSATLQVGKAELTATGSYATTGNTTTTQLKVNGQGMPIDDLEAFLPSLGVMLPPGSRLQGGVMTAALTISGPTGAPAVDGPVEVANTQLAGFDLGQKLAGVAALAGVKTGATTTVQALSSTMHYGPDGIRTDAINSVVTGVGSATGNGTISPGGALDYKLVVTLASGVGAVASKAVGLLSDALGSGSAKGVPVTIGGTTSNPTFMPDLGAIAGGVVQNPTQATKALGKKLGGLLGR